MRQHTVAWKTKYSRISIEVYNTSISEIKKTMRLKIEENGLELK